RHVDVAAAQELDVAGIGEHVVAQAIVLAFAGHVEEGAVERVTVQRQERDQREAGGHQLPRLQGARTPRQDASGLACAHRSGTDHASRPARRGRALTIADTGAVTTTPARGGRSALAVARNGEAVAAAANGLDRLERAFRVELL